MKIISCNQRTFEWYEARLGKPTASSIWKLISQSGKIRSGKTPQTYLNALLAERLTRKPTVTRQTDAMERGSILEDQAREWYARTYGVKVNQIGFAVDDSRPFGCSPDGFLDNYGLEIKCPLLPTFMEIATTFELPEAHFVQVQTCMHIFNVDRWDYLAYTDVRGLFPVVIKCERNVDFCACLEVAMHNVCAELDRQEDIMRKQGHGVPKDTPIDLGEIEREVSDAELASMGQMNAGEI